MYDDDFGAEAEAIETERQDADREQAQMEAIGRLYDRAEAAGVCTHGRAYGYISPPVYPEQDGLLPGQLACAMGCGRVFDSDAEWLAAQHEAIGL